MVAPLQCMQDICITDDILKNVLINIVLVQLTVSLSDTAKNQDAISELKQPQEEMKELPLAKVCVSLLCVVLAKQW